MIEAVPGTPAAAATTAAEAAAERKLKLGWLFPETRKGWADRREMGKQTRVLENELEKASNKALFNAEKKGAELHHDLFRRELENRAAERQWERLDRLSEKMAGKGEGLNHYIGRRGAGGVAWDATKATGKGIGKATSATYGAVKGSLNKGKNVGLIAAGVIAGTAVLGYIASSWRGDRKRASKDELESVANTPEAIPPVMAAQDMMAMQNAQTMMGVPPQPGEHANRVLAGRGMAQQVAGAGQPNMSVVPEEAVQSLGPTRT